MKTKVALLFCFISFTITAQTYKSILTDSITKWSIVELGEYTRTSEWITGINNQTFHGYIYKPLIHYYTDALYYFYIGGPFENKDTVQMDKYWADYNPGSTTLDQNGEYYMRESDDFSKLFIYDNNKKQEYLISDLTLQKGDTFPLTPIAKYVFNCPNDYSIVDSVYYENELKHIRLDVKLGYSGINLTFIESIGPNLGIFYLFGSSTYNQGVFCLQCFKNKNIFFKSEESFEYKSPCAFDNQLNPVSNLLSNRFKIIQTKVDLKFIFDNCEPRVIKFYNTTGNVVSINKLNSNEITIDKKSLKHGIYILKISSDTSVFSKKIILY